MQDRKGSDPGYLVPGNRNPIHIFILHTRCAGFSKTGARYRVPGSGYLAPGTRYLVPNRRRGPDTEHRRPSLATEKRAHGVCILYPASLRHDSPGW